MAARPAAVAQLILRPGSGETVDPAAVTAEDLERLRPRAWEAAAVRTWFERAGFQVEESSPIGLTLTGPAELFARVFGATAGEGEIPLERLPEAVRERILRAGFERPKSIGPGGDGP